MHGEQGGVVVVEVDEPVVGRLAGELVSHHLDGDDVLLAHDVQGLQQERLVHVRLQLEESRDKSYSFHSNVGAPKKVLM